MSQNFGTVSNYAGGSSMPLLTTENIPPCDSFVRFRRKCGHVFEKAKCAKAFDWASSVKDLGNCFEFLSIPSPLCNHIVMLPCNRTNTVKNWYPWKYQGSTNREIKLVKYDDPLPEALPGLRVESFVCKSKMTFQRQCGHEEHICCACVFYRKLKPCQFDVQQTRASCDIAQSFKCKDSESFSREPCENLVVKRCSKCQVNEALVECYRESFLCMKDVLVAQDCGHMVKWCCGTNVDPRASEGYKYCPCACRK